MAPNSDNGLRRFCLAYEKGKGQIVWRRVVADLETPVSTYLKLAAGRTNSFLLESVEGGATKGRYSIIGLMPDLILKVVNGEALVNRAAAFEPEAFKPANAPPLKALRTLVAESQIAAPKGVPAQSAGLYGYLGYDMVRQMEKLPEANPDPLGTPDAILVRPSLLAVFDTLRDELYITAPVYFRQNVSAAQAHEAAQSRIEEALARLERALPHSRGPAQSEPINIQSNTSKKDYLSMVEKARDYITRGDVFQVVLSQRFSADFTLPPTALYRALRRTNPSPYMYFLDFGEFAIAGSSPEILVQVDKGKVTIRPIAGTRKRGATPSRTR